MSDGTEMGDDFKTIGSVSAEPQTRSSRPLSPELSNSLRDPSWCLKKAKAIFGCYRRDEAHDPETFALALAVVLADFPADIVDYVSDPRTGVVREFPMGLPNIGQIRELCEQVQDRKAKALHYASNSPRPFVRSGPIKPPAPKPGQYSYTQFLEMAERGEILPRPIGRFEKE